MNQTIYKFPLKKMDGQNIIMPRGAEILTVQTQNEIPCLWALVNPEEKETDARFIEMVGTGHPIANDMATERKYIGTFQLYGGTLVFHCFEYTGA